MDEQPSPSTGFTSESTSRKEDSAQHDRYTGAFFPKAREFVIAGGFFTSITNITRPEPIVPPDFRMISLGDLDLRREIRLESPSGTAHRRSGVVSARRVYSARLHGCNSNMTVVLYQGRNSEEEWWRGITRHSHFRHPNIVQLFGTVKSPGLHAAIYLDDLIPAQEVIQESYGKAPMFPTYLWACMESDLADADEYLQAVSGNYLLSDPEEYAPWIRRTTGRLSVELTTNLDPFLFLEPQIRKSRTTVSLLDQPRESEIVTSMTLTDYHEICRTRQAEVCLSFSQKNVKVGAVYLDIATQPSIGDCPEIVSSYLDDLKCDGWQVTRQPTTMQPLGFKMESGWTRVHSSVVARDVKIRASFSSSQSSQNWLTQANFVFNCLKNLQIEPALADYKDVLLIETVIYFVDKDPSFNCPDIPSGYLFLCPLVNLQSDKASKSLEYAAYWSPDPSGATRMNAEQAETAGFPRLRWVVTVEYCRWEENVYAGLRTFHTGKGFDPDSQDLARHLGYPLYKVPSDIGSEIPLVQVEEADAVNRDEEILMSDQVEMISIILGHTRPVKLDEGLTNSQSTHGSIEEVTNPMDEDEGTLAY